FFLSPAQVTFEDVAVCFTTENGARWNQTKGPCTGRSWRRTGKWSPPWNSKAWLPTKQQCRLGAVRNSGKGLCKSS
uniref:Uncharacterized protein n=1 Tax=Podarcis muralis TaxID=64176 RepID=A0A670HNV2_PODMU